MELKSFFAQDIKGNSVPSASVFVYEEGTEVLVSSLLDKHGNSLGNPFSSESNGLIQFAAPNGRYDLRVESNGSNYVITVDFFDAKQAVADLVTLKEEIDLGLSSRFAPAIANAVVLGGDQYGGWVLRVRLHDWAVGGEYELSPDVAQNIRLSVFGDGFSDAGVPVRVSREVIGTVLVRQSYPSHSSVNEVAVGGDVELLIALDDYIYENEEVYVSAAANWAENTSGESRVLSGTTMMRVRNESVLKYPNVIAKWSITPYQEVSGSAHLECVAAHAYASNRGMLAAVKFELTGRSSGHTESVTVSEMEISNWRTDVNPVQVYQCDINTSGFTPGELLDARFIAYPKIGNAAALRDTADQVFPSIQLPANLPLKLSDGSATPYAYVDPVSGNDVAGVVSDVIATAEAAPYATIKAAASGVEAFNARGHLGGAEIRLMAGDHAGLGASMISLTPGDSWLTITRDPAAERSLVNITGGTSDDVCDLLRIHDVTLLPTSSDAILFDGTDGATPATSIWLDDVSVIGEGAGVPLTYRVGYIYMTALNSTNAGVYLLRGFSTTPANNVLTRGVSVDGGGSINSHCFIGSSWEGALISESAENANREYQDGGIVAFNTGMSIVTAGLRLGGQVNSIGRAIFGNLFESIQAIQPCWSISADGNEIPISNVLMFHNTVVGSRTNIGYNDSGLAAVAKGLVFSRGNIFMEWNHKDDVFAHPSDGPQSDRVGSWAIGHKVGFSGDLVLQGDSVLRTVCNGESWLGEYEGYGCAVGSATFVDDQSTNAEGAGAGGGDYRLSASGDAMRVPVSRVALPYDLQGVERNTSGMSASGAYELLQG
ncbi:MAG: hypothetical protein ACPGF7_13735 [Pontibacterium sp.]